jgi:monoamine oxidase
LTQRFGIELVKQNTDGDCIFHDENGATSKFPYGKSPKVSPLHFVNSSKANADSSQFTTAEVEDLERIRDEIHDLSVSYGSKGVDNFDQLSLEQFVVSKGGSKRTLDMIRIWSRVMLGVEAAELSAQFFIEYNGKGGGLKTLRSDQKGGGQYLRFRKGMYCPSMNVPHFSNWLQEHNKSLAVLPVS